MAGLNVVGFCGSHHRPSRSSALVGHLVRLIGDSACLTCDITDLGETLGTTFSRDGASPAHLDVWDAVERCDVLVVGTPVYKASYTGLFKHFFDLLPPDSLKGRPVVLTTNARSPAHALMIEHQLSPLFRFFGAFPLPDSIFALDEEFSKDAEGRYLLSDGLRSRCEMAARGVHRAAGGGNP